ncbi:MAG: membrane protein insertase YidC [Saprospiraceae bacterium]|nr:membrane protein insertase YidC [Saprospiraceae bacterium]
MDKNQGIGVLLLFVVLIGYYMITSPSQAEIEKQQRIQDSINQIKLEQSRIEAPEEEFIKEEAVELDSVQTEQLKSSFGPFAAAMEGESNTVVLQNEDIMIVFDTKGGRIKEAILKDHFKVTEDSSHVQSRELLSLMEDKKNRFEYLIPTDRYGLVSTSDMYFLPRVKDNELVMEADLGNGKSIQQVYHLPEEGFSLDYKLNLNGVSQFLDRDDNKLRVRWHHYLDRIELNTTFEKYYSTVYFKESNESSDYCNCRGDDKEELENKKFDWVSHVNQFFNTSFIAVNKKFENGVFETVMMEDDDPDLKLIKSEFEIPLELAGNEVIEFDFFIGPNEFKPLKAYNNELEQIIPFGRSIFGTINRYLIRPFFDWLSSFVSSKGLVIILLIFIIKMMLYPLMYKMLHSQAKMGALKPELAHLKVKYKDKPQQQQMETMKIYREYGVSPLGGCMPMILQMPIWYALFRFFPASITFRQEPFLWATDLSSFDVITWLPFSIPAFGAHISLFTILWAITTIIYSYYNMKHMDMSANPAMKYVQYFMPVTFLFFFNTYASGLTCYMFFSNLFNIAQTVITKRFVFDDEKILTELNKQKSKPKKKGRFQEKLEEAMKQQQQVKNQRDTKIRNKKKR